MLLANIQMVWGALVANKSSKVRLQRGEQRSTKRPQRRPRGVPMAPRPTRRRCPSSVARRWRWRWPSPSRSAIGSCFLRFREGHEGAPLLAHAPTARDLYEVQGARALLVSATSFPFGHSRSDCHLFATHITRGPRRPVKKRRAWADVLLGLGGVISPPTLLALQGSMKVTLGSQIACPLGFGPVLFSQ
jgi:hypothetical protein